MKLMNLFTRFSAAVFAIAALSLAPTWAIAEDAAGYVSRQQGTITTQNLVPAGTATAGSAFEWVTNGASTFGVDASGTYTGALSLQGTIDGLVWETLGGTPFIKQSTGATSATIASAATGQYIVNVPSRYKVRITGLAAMTGSVKLTILGSPQVSSVSGGGAGDASASNQTSGAQKTQIVDGSANVIGATANALDVNIKSGASSGAVAQGSTTSGQTGSLIQGAVTTAAPSYTTAQTSPISLTLAGATRYDLQSLAGTTISASNGVTGSGTQRVTIASDSTGQVSVTATAGVGSLTEAAPGTDTASSGLNGRLQRVAQNLTTLNTSVNADPNYTQTPGSAVPTRAIAIGARSGANLVQIIQGDTTAKIDVSTATTTQLVALSGSTKVYVTSLSIIAGGTGNIKFVYGTGSSCGTGTTDLTANYNLTAQSGLALGAGLGPVLVVPASQALCVTTSAAVQMSGHVTYTQF